MMQYLEELQLEKKKKKEPKEVKTEEKKDVKENGEPDWTKGPWTLILDVPTRWNSTVDMLDRVIMLKSIVTDTLIKFRKLNVLAVTENDWTRLKLIAQSLRPFRRATSVFSGSKYATITTVFPVVHSLIADAETMSKTCVDPFLRSLYAAMTIDLKSRWEPTPDIWIVATFLDPRWRLSKHSAYEERAKKELTVMMKRVLDQRPYLVSKPVVIPTSTPTPGGPTPGTLGTDADVSPDQLADLIFFIDAAVSQQELRENDPVQAEIDRYSSMQSCPPTGSILRWWKEHEDQLPIMAVVAKRVLCVPASSVPCEQLFSKAGLLVAGRRNRMSSNQLRNALYLQSNHGWL